MGFSRSAVGILVRVSSSIFRIIGLYRRYFQLEQLCYWRLSNDTKATSSRTDSSKRSPKRVQKVATHLRLSEFTLADVGAVESRPASDPERASKGVIPGS